MKQNSLRVLFIETDPDERRAVEMFIHGFTRSGLDFQAVSTLEDARERCGEDWDVVLVRSDQTNALKTQILDQVRNRFGALPVIDLGQTCNDLITAGIETSIDEFLPNLTVSSVAVLRSINHLIERRRLESHVTELQDSLVETTHTDSLTGLWNHTYIAERIKEEFQSWQRYRHPLTICLFETVDFGHLNDVYGFEVADDVLRKCGELIRQGKRNTDYAGRWGNSGFCQVFPKTPTASTLVGVERLRNAIKETLFTGKTSENFTIDMCFGVAQLCEEYESPEDLVGAARRALKKAKSQGSGCIEVMHGDPTSPYSKPSDVAIS